MTIHTFELIEKINFSAFHKIKDWLFECAVGHPNFCFEDKHRHCIIFSGWSSNGITISLSYTSGEKFFYYLRLRINPSKLLGNFDPTALFSPTPENISLLGKVLVPFLGEFPVPCLISDFSLHRIDLCQNRVLQTQAEVLEYLRLLKTSASSFHWEFQQFGDERDNHSFRCRSSRYQVTGYDKLYEIAQKERLSSYDGGPLFRLEVALFSPGIHYLRTNGYLPDADWLTQLLACGTDGHTIMRYVLNKLLPPGDYFTFEGARQIIRESHFPHPKQNKLCTFLLEINRCEQIDTITIKAHRNGRKRLQQLCELNINPVLINPSIQISCLPSLFPVPCI